MRRFVVGDEDNLFGIDEDREHENGQSRANLKVPPPIKTIDTKGMSILRFIFESEKRSSSSFKKT